MRRFARKERSGRRPCAAAVALVLPLVALGSCGDDAGAPGGEVVLYSSIDEPDLRQVVERFEREHGIRVHLVTDTEATKTTVLAERIEAERANPRADVYWGNEVFHAIDLAEKGVFAPYRPRTAEDVPARWRDEEDRYTCVGVRYRTIAVSARPEDAERVGGVRGIEDLANPAFRDRIGVCHPAFGTATGHFAAMLVIWGEDRYRRFLEGLRDNHVKLLGGNAAVTEQIGAGRLLVGPTDNDDVQEVREAGLAVADVVPDQGPDGMGTLLVPGAVALVAGAPHEDAAKKLIDAICDPSVERTLIARGYLAWGVRDAVPLEAMDVDVRECARRMREAIEIALGILQER